MKQTNQSALVSYITKVSHHQSSKNSSGMKGSNILWNILARKKVLEKVVKVMAKGNEQEIKSNDYRYLDTKI